MLNKEITGRCLCGSIEFGLIPPTDFLSNCHCQSCRLSHGAPFVTWTSVPKDRFRFLKGENLIVWYSSSPYVSWGFCPKCGSSLLYNVLKEGHPESPKLDRMYVSAGSLISPLDRELSSHVSYEEKLNWLPIFDSLPKFKGKGIDKMEETTGQIDTSLTDHTLRLSYEERIEAHESALQLVRDLQEAGKELHARQSKSPT